MSKLVILRGVPASGKSTYADELKAAGATVVNRDSIRFALFGKYWGVDEDVVTDVEHTAIRSALEARHETVVVDATNIRRKFVSAKLGYASEFGAEVEYVDFPIDLETAVMRDALRDRHVGATVIEKFFRNYDIDRAKGTLPPPEEPYPFFERYIPDLSKPSAYIVDTDGTVADGESLRGPFDTHLYHLDLPRPHVIEVVQALYAAGHRMVGVSGRDVEFMDVTQDWWKKNDVPWDDFFMRPHNDERNDAIIKYELLKAYIEPKYNVLGAFDDRPRVYRMWRTVGIPVFDVGPGKEF